MPVAEVILLLLIIGIQRLTRRFTVQPNRRKIRTINWRVLNREQMQFGKDVAAYTNALVSYLARPVNT
jgi:hypothetical protein